MTFYELLTKFSIEELWYILQYRHDLSKKPIRAERIFNLYKLAREELIALHADNSCTDNVLVCEFTIAEDYGGAPDSWIHCSMLSRNENNKNEKQQYAMDFVPWNELIDCEVSEASLAKLGALVCTAEILWEITFHGFSVSTFDDESKKLQRTIDDIDSGKTETYPMDFDDWKPNEEEIAMEEKAIVDWLINAPEKVKDIVFGFYAAEVCGRNEDVDDITVDETLKRLKSTFDNCSVDGAGEEDYRELLGSMANDLDVNKQYLLLSKMFGSFK